MYDNVNELSERLMEQVALADYLREVRELVERIQECRERRDAIDRQIGDLENEKENLDGAEADLRSRLSSRKQDATQVFGDFLEQLTDGVLD